MIFGGARARFKINGRKVAYAGDVSGEETIDNEAVDVLDLIETLEHVPVGYRCSLNTRVFRNTNRSLKNLGIFPKNDNILTSGVLEAAIEDTEVNVTTALFQGVRAASKSFDVGARALVTEALSFQAIRCLDESMI